MRSQYLVLVGVASLALVSLSKPSFADPTQEQIQALQQQLQKVNEQLKARDAEVESFRRQLQTLTEMVNANTATAQKAQDTAQASAAKADATAAKVTGTGFPIVNADNPPPNTAMLNKNLTPANVVLEPLQPTMNLINNPNTWLGLYGSIEGLIQATTHAEPGTPLAPAPHQGTRLGEIGSSWMTPDRIGFTGAHLINEKTGLNVIFRAEAEYQTPTGNQDTPGVIFNRDAWIGLEGKDFGKLTVGRQNTLGRDAIQFWGSPYGSDFANLGEGGWINQERTQAVKEYVGGTTGSRADASVVYKRLDGNWYYAAMYQFGAQQGTGNSDNAGPGGVPDPAKINNGSSQAVGVAYNFGNWRLGGLYNHSNVNGGSNQVFGVGGNISITPEVRLNGGYLIYTADQAFSPRRRDNIITLGGVYAPDSHWDYILAYNGIWAHDALRDANGNTLSPYSDTSAAVFDPGGTGMLSVGPGSSSGQRHTLYGSIRYKIDNQTLVFLGFTYTKTNSGFFYDQLNGTNTSTDIGFGGVYNF